MRLRRETGDFNIVIANSAASIPAGLQAEQMLGQVIETAAGVLLVVTSVTANEDATVLTLGTADTANVYAYTVATGAIAVTAAG